MTNELALSVALDDAHLKYHEYRQAKEVWEAQDAIVREHGMSGTIAGQLHKIYLDKLNARNAADRRVLDLKLETTNEA